MMLDLAVVYVFDPCLHRQVLHSGLSARRSFVESASHCAWKDRLWYAQHIMRMVEVG
jgi:hypothetical protein